MGTSTQTYKSYYCANCQLLAQYDNTEVTIDKCALSNEYITNELWNQMIARLKAIETFGKKDTAAERQPKGASNLEEKNDWDIITYDDYKKLLTSIGKDPEDEEDKIAQHKQILGNYSDDLKEEVKKYKIPTTRYKDATKQCCDACEYGCQSCDTCQNCNNYTPCGSCEEHVQTCVSIYYGNPCNRYS